MNVPFNDLSIIHNQLKSEIHEAINGVIDKSDFILGEEVGKFEEEFAVYCGCDNAVGVASGTDALYLSLKSLGVGPGHEVITAANTFISTVLAIHYTGATPVLVDIDPETFNIDLSKVQESITPHTKVILPVHLYGNPVDLKEILKIAKLNSLYIVEDACQAHGASDDDIPVGSFMGCFSFYPGKNLGGFGDGGIISVNDDVVYEDLLKLRNYGSVEKYHHDIIGYNSRLDTIQAAILRVKLKYLGGWNNLRKEIAFKYEVLLLDTEEIITPSRMPGHVFHQYVIRTQRRDDLKQYLTENGIQAGIHYPIPIHKTGAFKDRVQGSFPVTDQLSNEILSLPIFPGMTDKQIEYVADIIKEFFTK